MKQTTFHNGQKVCVLGQGTWNMGKCAIKQTDEIAAIRADIDIGMKIIDTAEMYDNEAFIGKAIKGLRDKVFLTSKVLPQNAGNENIVDSCENSLQRLNTDYLDLYLLHWKGTFPFAETVTAMNKLQQAGKIRSWGVSNIDVFDMETIRSLPGGNNCATNQVLYNLQNRGVEYDLIPLAQQVGMPIMAYSPLGEGQLEKHPILEKIARKYKATSTQIALAWTIRNKGVIAIPKASTVKHVKENFESLSLSLDADDIKLLDIAFKPPTKKEPLVGW